MQPNKDAISKLQQKLQEQDRVHEAKAKFMESLGLSNYDTHSSGENTCEYDMGDKLRRREVWDVLQGMINSVIHKVEAVELATVMKPKDVKMRA